MIFSFPPVYRWCKFSFLSATLLARLCLIVNYFYSFALKTTAFQGVMNTPFFLVPFFFALRQTNVPLSLSRSSSRLKRFLFYSRFLSSLYRSSSSPSTVSPIFLHFLLYSYFFFPFRVALANISAIRIRTLTSCIERNFDVCNCIDQQFDKRLMAYDNTLSS